CVACVAFSGLQDDGDQFRSSNRAAVQLGGPVIYAFSVASATQDILVDPVNVVAVAERAADGGSFASADGVSVDAGRQGLECIFLGGSRVALLCEQGGETANVVVHCAELGRAAHVCQENRCNGFALFSDRKCS